MHATEVLRKITAAFGKMPIPKRRINIGIQARPGTGRIKSNSGLARRSTHLNQAIMIPIGTPNSTPREQGLNKIL